jgi:protein Mpv17
VPTENNEKSGKKKLSLANTAKKFVLDQAVGGPVNTALFIAGMAGLRGLPSEEIVATVRSVGFALSLDWDGVRVSWGGRRGWC